MFDESSFFMVEFSIKEMGIISAHISTRAKAKKEKAKGIGDARASTSERIPTPPTSPSKSPIESIAKEEIV